VQRCDPKFLDQDLWRLRAYPSRAPVAGRPISGASRRCSSSPYFSRAPRRA
jgi:hypothetical protein